MCWPSCKGGAYLAVSIFIYRSILVSFVMISSSITGNKSTYLPISVMEELLLQLVYFIFLFSTSAFVLIGLESNSFNYMLYSSLSLSFVIFLRYLAELIYIYSQAWDSLLLKLPGLYLHLALDFVLLLILLFYARRRLRRKAEILALGKKIEESEGLLTISNDLNLRSQNEYSSVPVRAKDVNCQNQIHFPPIVRIEEEQLKGKKKPETPVEEDDKEWEELCRPPPPVPLALPEFEGIGDDEGESETEGNKV